MLLCFFFKKVFCFFLKKIVLYTFRYKVFAIINCLEAANLSSDFFFENHIFKSWTYTPLYYKGGIYEQWVKI